MMTVATAPVSQVKTLIESGCGCGCAVRVVVMVRINATEE